MEEALAAGFDRSSDEGELNRLTGAPQAWLALCRRQVIEGRTSEVSLLAAESPQARVFVEQSRATWKSADKSAGEDSDPDELLEDEPEDIEAALLGSTPNPTLSAAMSLAALAQGLTGIGSLTDACSEFTRHADRARLCSVGSQLMAAGTAATSGGDALAESVLEFMRQGASPSRGYGVLMALELVGQRPKTVAETRMRVVFSSFLAVGRVGEVGTLRLELLADGPSGLHPDPARMHFLHTDASFVEGLSAAWAASRLDRTAACVVWSIAMDNEAPANDVEGGSLAAAFAVGLDDLAPTRRYLRNVRPWRIDPNCVITAGLDGEKLTAVAGYSDKLAAARSNRFKVIVASDAFELENTGGLKLDSYERLHGARTVADAVREARTRVNRRFYATAATIMVLIVSIVVAGVYIVEMENRMSSERTAAHALMMVAASANLLDKDPALARQFAVAAYRTDPTAESRSQLLATTGVDTPIRVRGDDDILRVAANPGGSLIAIGGRDRVIRLIEVRGDSVSVVSEFEVSTPVRDGLAISPDEKTLAIAGEDQVALWDISSIHSPSVIATFEDVDAASVAFSPDGRHFVTGEKATDGLPVIGGVRRWDISDRRNPVSEPMLEFDVPNLLVSYSYDGKFLAAGGGGGHLRLWSMNQDASSDPVVVFDRAPQVFDGNWITALVFSPVSNTLVAAGLVSGIEVFTADLNGWTVSRVIPSPRGEYMIMDMSISRDGQYLAAVGEGKITRIWSLREVSEPVSFSSLSGARSIAFSPSGDMLATGGEDGYLRLWPMRRPRVLGGSGDWYQNLALNQSGHPVLPVLPSLGTRAQQYMNRAPDKTVRAVEFNNERSIAVTKDLFGEVEIVDIGDPDHPQLLSRFQIAPAHIASDSMHLSVDGNLLAVLMGTSTVGVWDIRDLRNPIPFAAHNIENPVRTAALAFGRSGLLAVGTMSGEVYLFDARNRGTLRLLRVFDVSDSRVSVAFSANGDRLAIGAGSEISVIDVSAPDEPGDRAIAATVPEPWDWVLSMAFSPDGRTLAATGAQGGTVKLWNIDDRQTLSEHATIPGSGLSLTAFFSPDSRYIALTGLGDMAGTIKFWSVDAEDVLKKICDSGADEISKSEWRRYLAGISYRENC